MTHRLDACLDKRPSWHHYRFLGVVLLVAAFSKNLSAFLSFYPSQRSRSDRDAFVNGPRWPGLEVRGPPPMRLGPSGGGDPVNNVSPEIAAAGRKYAQRYEDIFMAGNKLWHVMKQKDEVQKKIYFIGTNGNSGPDVAEAVMDSLAYIPAPDGTYFIRRKPGVVYPKIQYFLEQADKKLAAKSSISPVDLYVQDQEAYRQLEHEALKEFAETDTGGFPAAYVVGESAVTRPENVEILKQGFVIWLDCDAEWSWGKTQWRRKQGGGLFVSMEWQPRPPVWAIANGWDGDIDDAEGKMEYGEILKGYNKIYEELATIRVRTDVPGLAENPYWAAERIIKAMSELYGVSDEAVSVEEEVLEKDLEKFLEGARLSKYLKPALEWCNKQGAASIEEIIDSVDDFAEALELKPLERKRLEKAAATVATSA